MDGNLYTILQKNFPADLSRPVIETEEGFCYSYLDLDQETARYAGLLAKLGLTKGDRLLAQVDKSPQNFFLYLACIRAGVIYLPLNPAYRKHEMQHVFSDAEPKAIVCSPTLLDEWRQLTREAAASSLCIETLDKRGRGSLVDRAKEMEPQFATISCDDRDIAAILYTSGTTGRPKGAMLTHLNLSSNARALHDYWQWTPADVLLHAVPLFHAHGLFIASNCALLSGTKIILLRKFNVPTIIRCLPRATVFMGVPTYYTRLLEHADFTREACRKIRLFISGSGPLLEQTFHAFQERTGHQIVDRYGMTESLANSSNPVDRPRAAGTVGLPLPGVCIRVADANDVEVPPGVVGELQIKGDNVLAGYWRQPAETAAAFTADGLFRSGDLGKRGADGYLSVVGRSKDLIISGGLNVYAKEVESAIDQLAGVIESAVIGVPHPDFGEAVIAVVVPSKGREELTEARIIAELKRALANYKVPKRVFFADDLPRNTMGKVQKNILRTNPEYAGVFTGKSVK